MTPIAHSTTAPPKAYDCPSCGGAVSVGLVHHCPTVPRVSQVCTCHSGRTCLGCLKQKGLV